VSEFVIEVDESNFESEVLDRSRTVPVLVDFWAPWCGPCLQLGPLLEELASAGEGRWYLAKVNSDENPALARAYGIRGIPAVKAFVNGVVRTEFTGALPKSSVERFLREVVPDPLDRLVEEAKEAARAGDTARERAAWDHILADDPSHALALIRRARFLLADADLSGARAVLARVPGDDPLRPDADHLLMLVTCADHVQEAGGSDAARARAADDPSDVRARHDFACALAVAGDFDGALAEFLEVVRLDRTFEDDAGRRFMLAIFGMLGEVHPLTVAYRAKLSAELF